MVENIVIIGQQMDSKVLAELVQKASQFKSHISLVVADKTANAKSIMGLISLNLQAGCEVKIIAHGEDAGDVMPALQPILG